MVVDVQPVAHVEPVAVERHLPPVEQVRDEQRDDLLRELVRPVVVRAAGDAHRQAVGAVVGPGQQVRRRLRRRVRRVRLQRVRLRPRAPLDRAVHLVGGHVHEPRRPRPPARPAAAPACRRRSSRRSRRRRRSTGRRATRRRSAPPRRRRPSTSPTSVGVADVALARSAAAGESQHRGEVGQRARVGQQVQHDDLGVGQGGVAAGQGRPDVVRADEAGTAGHEEPHPRDLRLDPSATDNRRRSTPNVTSCGRSWPELT